MQRYIDNYCERIDPGLLDEPLNLISNSSFLIAAMLLWRVPREKSKSTSLLILLVFVIGVGSALFHSFAQYWSMLADVIPIGVYIAVFLALYSRDVLGLLWRRVVGLYIALGFVSIVSSLLIPKVWVSGSNSYLGPWVVLWYLMVTSKGAAKAWLKKGFLFFTVSLLFRSLDGPLCELWPDGTHFMWHVWNGALLYCTTRAYMVER